MAKTKADALIITCEHGGNRIPADLAAAFGPMRGLLATHRGWDPGALELARLMARRLRAPLFHSTISRLVVDLNRSERHPRIFSRATRALPADDRERLLQELYRPFRAEVAAAIQRDLSRAGKVVHISVHSFTPILAGTRRNADIGLLYDPGRRAERDLAAAWRTALSEKEPALRIRMNYPYRGTSDGHTTSLRGRFQPDRYSGIELEVNQAIVRAGGKKWRSIQSAIIESLADALAAPARPTARTSAPRQAE
jgi:predicted N-formylglutamate amidohydrolase